MNYTKAFTIFSVSLLVACQPSMPTVVSLPPNSTPIATTAPLAAQIYPSEDLVLSPGNVSDLVELKRLGKGWISKMLWVNNIIIMASSQGIYIYDADDLTVTQFIEIPNLIYDITIHPDGQHLVLARQDNIVQVWNIESGELVNEFEGSHDSDNPVIRVTFNGTGNTLAIANRTHTQLLDFGPGQTLYPLAKLPGGGEVAFNTNGLLAFANIEIWNPVTNAPGQVLGGHYQGTNNLVFAPDGTFLVSTGLRDGLIQVWNINTGTLYQSIEMNEYVSHLVMSPAGQNLAVSGESNKVYLLNLNTGDISQVFTGHLSQVTSLAFSPDGKIFISSGIDGTVNLWDVDTGEILSKLTDHLGPIREITFNPVEPMMASVHNNMVYVWDIESGRVLSIITEHDYEVSSLVFSPDGQILASGSVLTGVILWDIRRDSPISVLQPNSYPIAIAFDPNGRIIAISDDKTIHLWNVKTGQLSKTLEGHQDEVRSVAFSPDGQTLVTSSSDDTIRFWDVSTVQSIDVINQESAVITLNSTGRILAIGDVNGVGKVWNVASKQIIETMETGYTIQNIAFSPNGHILAIDNSLWDANNGQLLHEFKDNIIAFSYDGVLLVTGGEDGVIRYWGLD